MKIHIEYLALVLLVFSSGYAKAAGRTWMDRETIATGYVAVAANEAPTTVAPRVVYVSGTMQSYQVSLALNRKGYHILGASSFTSLDSLPHEKEAVNFGKTIGAQIVIYYVQPMGLFASRSVSIRYKNGRPIYTIPPTATMKMTHFLEFLAR